MRGLVYAKDDGNADHSLSADEADLDLALLRVGDRGADAALRKIDVLDRLVCLDEDVPERKRHALQHRFEQGEIVLRQG